jgi:dTDP-4-dehydrorhamnose reductase
MAERISMLRPWAVINATGYVRVDDAEADATSCHEINSYGAIALAHACSVSGIPLLSFSSDLVFDGKKGMAYTELDPVNPLNVYGRSKAAAEEGILRYSGAMIVRTSSFFSPWDEYNFVQALLRSLSLGEKFRAAADVIVTPTYVPDLVRESLDLLMDECSGIWHITNGEAISWADFARLVATQAGYDPAMILGVRQAKMGWEAVRPRNSALESVHGICLPGLGHAVERMLADLPQDAGKRLRIAA